MRIVFFTENLGAGGKERRLIELVRELRSVYNYEILIILTENKIQYKYVFSLDVDIKIIKRSRLLRVLMFFYKFL